MKNGGCGQHLGIISITNRFDTWDNKITDSEYSWPLHHWYSRVCNIGEGEVNLNIRTGRSFPDGCTDSGLLWNVCEEVVAAHSPVTHRWWTTTIFIDKTGPGFAEYMYLHIPQLFLRWNLCIHRRKLWEDIFEIGRNAEVQLSEFDDEMVFQRSISWFHYRKHTKNMCGSYLSLRHLEYRI